MNATMMRATMGGNVLFIIMCIATGGISLVMAVVNYRNEGDQYRKNLVKRENDYNAYIASQETKIQELQEKERIISRQKYPSVEEELTYVDNFDARLFEKLKSHEDYLYLRIGEGTILSRCEIGYRTQEYREVADPLMDYPYKLYEKYKYIEKMPVMLNLTHTNAIGFIGNRTHLYQMMKNLILQMCIEHYYQDVKLHLIMGEEDKQYFEWARWFRNFREDNGMRNFAYDEDGSKQMLEYLYAQLSERENMKESEIKDLPTNIVLVYRFAELGEHPVSNYIEKASELGFVFIFFEEYVEKLNPECSKRIFLHDEYYGGYVQDIMDGEQIVHFTYPHIAVEKAAAAARKMACVYVDEVSLAATLTKNITLYELLGIMHVQDIDLRTRWSNSRIYDTMAAPLGVKSGDEVVYLDLHEKYHGPHGLVAGTTGSGKSEILQSYILSMATLFHPYEVGFIIIDFKGGGMVNQFRNLPHLNGAITNIDGREIDRSLSSIKAELKKRQRLFAEYEVNHINDYIRLYKDGKTRQPLPHLILIVDEFAELKSEQPEFMKELISAARIGRSLGVHLILATQKPSGVVNDQIWSNSKFKLCLKVQNQSDSNEVLKSPLAAEIREPGRAYLQVGNNEIFQLFQSAYSGAPVPNGAMGEQKKFAIHKVDLSGRRELIYEQKPTVQKGAITQLDAIVDYVEDYCKQQGIERLPDICLPPLPEEIPYTQEGYDYTGTDICVPIGKYDDPDNQYQGVMDVNFSQGNVIIVGSSQMGKTNLLQTMIRGLAERYTSDEVQMYILDYASMILKNFEGLKHVGDVITIAEEDRLGQFFKTMEEEVSKRKAKLAELGLTSYSAYREAGLTELPQIIVMVDNIIVFREMNAGLDANLQRLVRDGVAVGISVLFTSTMASTLGYRYMSNFAIRYALYCHDSGEYSSLLEKCKLNPKAIPGSCVLSIDKTAYIGQIYDAFEAEKEIERVKKIKEFIQRINQKDAGDGAMQVRHIPERLTKEIIREMQGEERERYSVAIGVNYATLELDCLTMENFPLLAFVGNEAESRIKYIRYSVEELLSYRDKEPVEVRIFDSQNRELQAMQSMVTQYTTDKSEFEHCLKDIIRLAKERKGKNLQNEPLEYLIVNDIEMFGILEEEDMLKAFKDMLTNYNTSKIVIALANVPDENIATSKRPILNLLLITKNLLVFQSLDEVKTYEFESERRVKYRAGLKEDELYFQCGPHFGKYKMPK